MVDKERYLERAYEHLLGAAERTNFSLSVVDVGDAVTLSGSPVGNVAETNFDHRTIVIASSAAEDLETFVCVLAHELAHVFDPERKVITDKKMALIDIEMYHDSQTPEGVVAYEGRGPVTFGQYKHAMATVERVTAEQELVAQTAAKEFCSLHWIDVRQVSERYIRLHGTRMTRLLRLRTDVALCSILPRNSQVEHHLMEARRRWKYRGIPGMARRPLPTHMPLFQSPNQP